MSEPRAAHRGANGGDLFGGYPVIPILTVDDPEVTVGLARALAAGGLAAVEVTLRTPKALDCIRAVATDVPDVLVGAGTILTARQMEEAAAAGARFLVSPGATDDLVRAARASDRVWLPGAGTASEAMRLAEAGFVQQKFFPAEPSGGVAFLRALAPVLPHVRFCPTGGIDAARSAEYLRLENVFAVGGSWVAPAAALASGDYATVTRLACEAAQMTKSGNPGEAGAWK
jgi:2-dehydro-3-deoxyphosphogluconate aldolase/(4S)-4-hydroxy-2-oxoglutarate aldolase